MSNIINDPVLVAAIQDLARGIKSEADLSSFPLRCPLAPENDFFQEELRHLIINNYRILYTATDHTVYILHARHGRQQWLKPENNSDKSHIYP